MVLAAKIEKIVNGYMYMIMQNSYNQVMYENLGLTFTQSYVDLGELFQSMQSCVIRLMNLCVNFLG